LPKSLEATADEKVSVWMKIGKEVSSVKWKHVENVRFKVRVSDQWWRTALCFLYERMCSQSSYLIDYIFSTLHQLATVPATRNKALCQWLSIMLLWSHQPNGKRPLLGPWTICAESRHLMTNVHPVLWFGQQQQVGRKNWEQSVVLPHLPFIIFHSGMLPRLGYNAVWFPWICWALWGVQAIPTTLTRT
jgi:hypothetical protein